LAPEQIIAYPQTIDFNDLIFDTVILLLFLFDESKTNVTIATTGGNAWWDHTSHGRYSIEPINYERRKQKMEK